MKLDVIIDVIAFIGGVLLSVGVFLEFGLGFSLIAFGVCLCVFALFSSYMQLRADNVSDS